MVHDPFRTQIGKVQEELKYCDRAVTSMLIDASLMLGRELYHNAKALQKRNISVRIRRKDGRSKDVIR